MQPTKQEIDLIYKHTDKDFKSMYNNEKSILVWTNKGTTIMAIADLPEEKFKSELAYARKKESGHKITWD